ncbi:MAG: DoxX family protein [Bacteroidota bacterium]
MQQIISMGRWIFVLPFAFFGLLHFGPLEFSLPYVPAYLPAPAIWVYFTGVCLLAFVLSAVLGKYDKLAAVLLAVMLTLFVVLVHIPAVIDGAFTSLIGSFRDLAMAGAALMYADQYAKDGALLTKSVAETIHN